MREMLHDFHVILLGSDTGLLSEPFYRWENWGLEELSNLLKGLEARRWNINLEARVV